MKTIFAAVTLATTLFFITGSATPTSHDALVSRQTVNKCCHFTGVVALGCPDFCPLGFKESNPADCGIVPAIVCGRCCCKAE